MTPYMQYQSSLWIFIAVLAVYSVAMTFMAMRNIPEFKIVAIEPTGTRLVTDSTDKVIERERQEFVKRFIRLYTNYDSESFSETIGHSTDWMSDGAWSRIEQSFKDMKVQILEYKMVQISEITKLEQSDASPLEFSAEVHTRQIYRGTSKKLHGTLILKLKAQKRTDLNPWGWEVDELAETWKEVP
jgi:hypothetical protein